MNLLKKIILKVSSNLKALDEVLNWFEQLNQPSIPKKDWLQCQLALAEGFTNAVRHAHQGLPDDTLIEVAAILYENNIEIQVIDCGSPFDLETEIKKQLEQPEKFKGGGRGLIILSKIADYLTYRRTEDNRNCLRIVRFYSPIKSEPIL
ncbi:ATP-binding protein [Oscillatoria salina]|uniref:ATP-binding protein n=1 Tax=Oscillatoria salina TaxID=331517 RepID=UPI001CC9D84D|nr:anti-sigma regulatory factor [Oscillatoria salina]